MLVFLITLLKDALLCLIVCTTLANMRRNTKFTFISLGMIITCFLMGIDIW